MNMDPFIAARASGTPPRQVQLSGIVDTHTHVFGPAERFPFAVTPAYAPPFTPFEAHAKMMDTVGLAYAVLVQPAPYADDCSAILDAVERSSGRLKGIGTAYETIGDGDLAALARGGICGLRFVETGGARMQGAAGFDALGALAPRMREHGIHAQIWADCGIIAEQADWLCGLGVPIIVEHMGRFDLDRGVTAPEFQTLLSRLHGGELWVKLGVCRTSPERPDYPRSRPFHDALVAANPDRLLWASDWPYVRMDDPIPDPGALIDLFDTWIGHDETLRRTILVSNPASLYGFSS